MLNLAGYQETELLYNGTRTLVYRALRLSDEQPVIIKVLRNEHPHFNELVQFRNQYVITQNLDAPYIVKPLALERYSNGYALVMPDEGAVALSSYWQDSEQSLKELLKIAIQLAEALHILTGEQIIHKDIKPANILIHPETGQVQLIDFSIASLLPKEQRQLVNPKGLEGTLAYIAPEQTGRMNRGIDYRTDFYSLGVTLYELLTGMLPFSISDPLELVHCHIAQTPIAPVDLLDAQGQPYSAMLSALIMKLMAKNAEDRYQSALGLKHDLERCLRSLEETGEIAEFELGERDVCDRFNIPEKLYGRETEVQTLLDAFDRVANGNSEMLLVAGFSGIGKTAVVNEVHKPIVRQKGYFINGKFDQFNRNIPFSAFVQAFRELMGQLLSESDEELGNWKTKILEALGSNGQVLIDVIPELERVIGPQAPATELSGTAAQNRFNLLFEKFIAVVTTPEHPLVMFLDDLQWADSASLNLMKVLMGESETGYLLLLGAYRDNEVSPAHPLLLTLGDLEKEQAIISTITLAPLPIIEVNRLVAETLSCPLGLAQPLTELVYQKTQGNPFFTTQFLKGLYEDDLILFNRELGYWECDLVRVRDASLTDDVVEFMTGRLQKLPQATQDVLKLAACIGNRFDLETLAIVQESNWAVAATDISPALKEGLVIPISQAYKFFQGETEHQSVEAEAVDYHFLHDRVQQAAYSLIPEEQKSHKHLEIGRKMLKRMSPKEQEKHSFQIANQVNFAITEISDSKERQLFARLNLLAGEKAKLTTAYLTAIDYFKAGICLLNTQPWKNQYKLTLELHSSAAEAAYLSGDFEEMSQCIKTVLDKAIDRQDCLEVYEIKLQGLKARNQLNEAIKLGLQILQWLEIELPTQPTQDDILNLFEQTQAALQDRSIQSLLDLPVMKNPKMLAATRILFFLCPVAYTASPQLLPIITFKQVQIALKYGNAPAHTHAYASMGLILCGFFDRIDAGYDFGQLALKLLDKLDARAFRASATFVAVSFTQHWKTSVRTTLPPLLEAYAKGLETGDIEHACWALERYGSLAYFISEIPLSDLEVKMRMFGNAIQKLSQHGILQAHRIHHQVILNWLGETEKPYVLAGEVYDETVELDRHISVNYRLALIYFYLNKLILTYVFSEYEASVEFSCLAEKYLDGGVASLLIPVFYTYSSLAQLAIYANANPLTRTEILKKVNINQEKLKRWATSAPMNFQHRVDLVTAEQYRNSGQMLEAIGRYDRAITGAKVNEYIQEEALANELFAKFYLEWGRSKEAALYMQEAYYCYARWGAKAKIDHLEANYPELLTPILQKQRVEFNTIDSLTSLTQTLTATLQTQTSSSTSISEALDFASILQAAQKLSSTIELDELLGEMTHIILTNAGAQKIALLTPNGQQWQLQARAELKSEGSITTQLQTQPLTAESPVPIRLIQYVKNTQEPVLINDAKTEITGILEGYLLKYQPQSIFCVPLLNQGNLVAIAYLEHPTTKGVFTPNRQTIIEFLCAQAAVALQNAQLYRQAKQSQIKAEQSQAQAEQALVELQQAQIQLVQSEKMSALGNLVAGVAHEINNPVGFLQGNIQPAQDYVQDLLGLIDVYQAEYPQANETVDDEIEAIDLAFIRADLPNLIQSMKAGVDRIRNISDSLRTFSRKDQEHKTAFNIHDGIDSTLLILKHRTKANEQRPKIEVLKNYGELPEVNCFPGQLNQVFMNILANAIDAFDEANQGKTYQEIEANPNTITITTLVVDEQVQIQIQDNGCGMKPETVERIFEQGFTTKDVGKGTGLGMAIAHQVITEKHGGKIDCQSERGTGTNFTITLPVA